MLKGMEWDGPYEPFHIMLDEYCIADISITPHARSRYPEQIKPERGVGREMDAWLWQCLKQRRIKPYLAKGYNAYLIDEDTVMIAELNELEGIRSLTGQALYRMVVVTFLGQISATPQLQDLKGYYARLAQPRRKKPAKKRRRRK